MQLDQYIIDGMAVVQEMVVYKNHIKTCKDLLDCFVCTMTANQLVILMYI